MTAVGSESLKSCTLFHWSRIFTRKSRIGYVERCLLHNNSWHWLTSPDLRCGRMCVVFRRAFCVYYILTDCLASFDKTTARSHQIGLQCRTFIRNWSILQRKTFTRNWPLCMPFPNTQTCNIIYTLTAVSCINRQVIILYHPTPPPVLLTCVSERLLDMTLEMRCLPAAMRLV